MKKLMLSAVLGLVAVSANAADLDPSCEAYFKAVDEYVAKAPEAVKQQMEASKQQMASMPTASQKMACEQAMEQLKQMPKM
ncbi:hypothetical protein EDC44_12124 [Cricetibacter osteomyelitidis]|uniref:TonB-dependent receptor n=1 Tax=Cricetibacter osteomyelitidis TaxID=1521931 RepID=A0A4V2T1E2_9PAST|nr:DUF5339 family protein [Cricetibacter osteomyelitidis]TCP93313.1 hypothetical protein EDC44_12124 [Cricetibacter osteomyelitidis]